MAEAGEVAEAGVVAGAGGVAESEVVAEAWWPGPLVAEAWWPVIADSGPSTQQVDEVEVAAVGSPRADLYTASGMRYHALGRDLSMSSSERVNDLPPSGPRHHAIRPHLVWEFHSGVRRGGRAFVVASLSDRPTGRRGDCCMLMW